MITMLPPRTVVRVTAPAMVHPDLRDVEVVERKGRGHPDSICDALAEAFCIGLARAYVDRCGVVLHHNVDKVLLAAGASAPRFGGGEIAAPFDVFLAGRATRTAGGQVVPVSEIAEEAARRWFRANLHALEPARHVRLHTIVHQGSAELAALSGSAGAARPTANDTSFAVGYAPASRLERIVLAVEQTLTSPAAIAEHPMFGEDVKVMGVRYGRAIELTIACAMIDRTLRGPADYSDAVAAARQVAERSAREAAGDADVRVTVNAADDIDAGRLYLTVTGTSAEAGDDGEAGRGNRVGGLITPCRPMTLEAAAGKNVATHVGKSYSLAAHQIARDLVSQVADVAEATCILVSRIGWPVDEPQLVELQVRTRSGSPAATVRGEAESIAAARLRQMSGLAALMRERGTAEAPAEWPGVLLF